MNGEVAIVGAGVGGLAAALACRRAGISFRLLDKQRSPFEGGFALTLWPNARLALQQLGMTGASASWMHDLDGGDVRSDDDALLYELPIAWMRRIYRLTPTCVRRSQLLREMWQLLGEPGIECREVIGAQDDGQQVGLMYANGEMEPFDAIIAADGVHSNIRRHIVRGALRSTHYTAWRGIAEGEMAGEMHMREYWGSGARFGFAHINPRSVYWFATLNHTRMQGHKQNFPYAELQRLFKGFPACVTRLLEATHEQMVMQHAVDFAPGTPLCKGRIALVGDAAHAVTPNLGMGGCLALEDGIVLADALREASSYSQAFLQYAGLRQRRVAMMARSTRFMGDITQWEAEPLLSLRNRLLQLVPQPLSHPVWRMFLGPGKTSKKDV